MQSRTGLESGKEGNEILPTPVVPSRRGTKSLKFRFNAICVTALHAEGQAESEAASSVQFRPGWKVSENIQGEA